jgi:superfamily II DNA or RNA helicase
VLLDVTSAARQLDLFSPLRAETPALQLRPYQVEALDAIEGYRQQGVNRQLLHLATGGGKTLVSCDYMRRVGYPALAMMHRKELAGQFISTMRTVWPDIDIGLVQAETNDVGRHITVALVQTLSSEKRFAQAFSDNTLNLVPHFLWTDESHHAASDTYKFVYGKFGLLTPAASHHFHLGVTATPKRGDDKALDDIYDVIAYSWGIRDGITQGFLCDLRGYTLTFANEDMADVHIRAGEYDQEELDKAVRKVARNEAIVECWLERARLEECDEETGKPLYRQTIAFCVSVKHAQELASTFAKGGVKADVVWGSMPDEQRVRVLGRFKSGKIDVLCNVGILTEGYDHPPTGCIIVARPTKNGGLYTQMIGRGTRTSFGKKNCLILDVADVSSKNSLAQPVTLAGAFGITESDGKPRKEIDSIATQLRLKGMPKALQNSPSVDGMDTRGGKEFDPFGDPFAGSEMVGFSWVKGGSGLTLELPKNQAGDQRCLVIVRDPRTWLFDVVEVTRRKAGENARGFNVYKTEQTLVNKHQFPSEELAAQYAGSHARKVSPWIDKLTGKNASWRNDELAVPTEGQLKMLRKLYTKGPPPGVNPRTLTKGQASHLIQVKLAQRVKVDIDKLRPAGDLVLF